MAVIPDGRGRAKSRTRAKRKMKTKKAVKRRNAPAAVLADPRYRKRVTKSAKAYSRKGRVPPEDEDI